MELDMERIQEVFGNSAIEEIRENKEDFLQNIQFVLSLGYKNVYELVELYPYTFLQPPQLFQKKVQELLDSLGIYSFEKIEENLEVWGALDES